MTKIFVNSFFWDFFVAPKILADKWYLEIPQSQNYYPHRTGKADWKLIASKNPLLRVYCDTNGAHSKQIIWLWHEQVVLYELTHLPHLFAFVHDAFFFCRSIFLTYLPSYTLPSLFFILKFSYTFLKHFNLIKNI